MPNYAYRCTSCESQFDVTLSITDLVGAQISCPYCKSMKTRRAITAPAVILKGKGFYKTDNRKEDQSEKL